MSISIMHPDDIERSIFNNKNNNNSLQQQLYRQQNDSGGDFSGRIKNCSGTASNININNSFLFNLTSSTNAPTTNTSIPSMSLALAATNAASANANKSSASWLNFNMDPRPIAVHINQDQQKVKPMSFQPVGSGSAGNGAVASSIGHLTHGLVSPQPVPGSFGHVGNSAPNDMMVATMLMMNNHNSDTTTGNSHSSFNLRNFNSCSDSNNKNNNESKRYDLKGTTKANRSSSTLSAVLPNNHGADTMRLGNQSAAALEEFLGNNVATTAVVVPSNVSSSLAEPAALSTSRKVVRTTKDPFPSSTFEFDESSALAPVPPSVEGQLTFDDNDVLSGRGGGTNVHPGNRNFRDMINMHRRTYLKARKNDKPAISRAIVRSIRETGGKFLRKDEKSGLWYEIGDDAAREKTSQALRQRAPEMRRLLFDNEQDDKPVTSNDELRKQRILAIGAGGGNDINNSSHTGRQNSSAPNNAVNNNASNDIGGTALNPGINFSTLSAIRMQLPSHFPPSLGVPNGLGQTMGLYNFCNIKNDSATGMISPVLLNAMNQQQDQNLGQGGSSQNSTNLTAQQQHDIFALLQQQQQQPYRM